jgi:hypothetical protein
MTEKETKTRRKTQQETPAQEEPQEKEQMATQPLDETEKLQEPVVSEHTERDSTKTGALVGAAKAIEEGVQFVGGKAPEVASFVLHRVRKGISVAYGTSSALVRDAYHAAGGYADKYKHKIEIKKLRAQREATSSRLGSIVYTRINIDGEPPEKTFSDQEITSLLQQIQDLDNEVVRVGKELEEH